MTHNRTFFNIQYICEIYSVRILCLRHFSEGRGNPKTDTVFMLLGVYNIVKEESLNND